MWDIKEEAHVFVVGKHLHLCNGADRVFGGQGSLQGFGQAAARLKGLCLEAQAIGIAHVETLHPAGKMGVAATQDIIPYAVSLEKAYSNTEDKTCWCRRLAARERLNFARPCN